LQFEFTEPQTEIEKLFGGHFSINAFGPIKLGDVEKFQAFIGKHAPPMRTPVYINSGGGHVETAIGLGRIIRDHWYSTHVGMNVIDVKHNSSPLIRRKRTSGKCISAATLMFLGGRLRYIRKEDRFGVHQFSFKDPIPNKVQLSQQLSAKISRYVFDMGIDTEFLELSSSTPNDNVDFIEHEKLTKIGVVTGGETDAKWSIHPGKNSMYVRGERDSLYGHHKVMLSYVKGGGFFFHAVIEAQGRYEELTNFGLVELVVDGERLRIDISDRCDRFTVGLYVNVIAMLTNKEAKVLAYSESFGVQIRFSLEAPMFLGISAIPTRGGTDELISFYECLVGPSE